ncbi:MAG TPA: nuclear transport factor 2 family protein [Cyclobacteriaceae bacterium]|nr:nuclear transport factor 2 family protein [Cyclobacteriaceae bacterium]
MKDFYKLVLFVCCFVLATQLSAQNVESLANAERAFAQTSIDKSIKAAFLSAFDENTIAFANGKPAPGREGWVKQEENNRYLFWWPVYADIAASGDFGWTTGPAEFGPDRSTKEARGGIFYSSVWKKNAAGEWKVLADMGSATYNPADKLNTFSTTSKPSKASKKDGASVKLGLLDQDRNYDEQLNKKKASFDAAKFSEEGRIHRRGIPPVVGSASIRSFKEDPTYVFEHVGGEVASSNDMAFTYGTVKVTSLKDGKETVAPLCYMRVWKLEGNDWKIVLDVVGG